MSHKGTRSRGLSHEERFIDIAMGNADKINKAGGIPDNLIGQATRDSLANPKSGTYYCSRRRRFFVIGHWEGKPFVIGGFTREIKARVEAEGKGDDPAKQVWRLFLDKAKAV